MGLDSASDSYMGLVKFSDNRYIFDPLQPSTQANYGFHIYLYLGTYALHIKYR